MLPSYLYLNQCLLADYGLRIARYSVINSYMAKRNNALTKNVEGAFYVDSSCIDCGTCCYLAPEHFASTGSTAFVHTQPIAKNEIYNALLALLDCPVAAIGAPKEVVAQVPKNAFPLFVTKNTLGEIYYCGWSSRQSFGASSWLIVRPEGNVLIDSPRWSATLFKQIKSMGNVKYMVLTHRDDVADHVLWSNALNCERWIHEDDADAAPPSEKYLRGRDCFLLGESFYLIPTPGHTAGSMVAVLGDSEQVLFSGDHLWWNVEKESLVASRSYCWWNWDEQIKSIKRLENLDVRWLLPGHGHAHVFGLGEWKIALSELISYVS